MSATEALNNSVKTLTEMKDDTVLLASTAKILLRVAEPAFICELLILRIIGV